jgi:hypothetical protein
MKHMTHNNYVLECPYCSFKTKKKLPIRKINGTFYINTVNTLPLNNCVTNDHICEYNISNGSNKCNNIVLFGMCQRHNKYLTKIYDKLNDKQMKIYDKLFNAQVLVANLFHELTTTDISRNDIIDKIDEYILKKSSISILKMICKYNNIKNYSKLKKNDLIQLLQKSI